MFFNAGADINDRAALYAQSNYADVFGRYRFFYRNPDHITLRTLREEHGFDGLLAGFTPFFDGDQEDFSFVGGIRGNFANAMLYDFSAGYGYNEIDFVLNNTINQSVGLGSRRKPGPTGLRCRRPAAGGDQSERGLLQAAFRYRAPGFRRRVARGIVYGRCGRTGVVRRCGQQRFQGFRAPELRQFLPGPITRSTPKSSRTCRRVWYCSMQRVTRISPILATPSTARSPPATTSARILPFAVHRFHRLSCAHTGTGQYPEDHDHLRQRSGLAGGVRYGSAGSSSGDRRRGIAPDRGAVNQRQPGYRRRLWRRDLDHR